MFDHMTEEKNSTPKNIFTSNLHIVLVIALIVASFALGSLYTKVKYLESNGGSLAAAKPSAQAPAAAGDAQPKVALKTPELTNDDRIRGNKNAKVTLVEYSDFECPFCIRFHPTMQQVMKEYGDKVKWVYRDYPLAFHANAQKEAEAGWCINELGGTDAFWKYVDAIFAKTTGNGTGFALEKLGPLAAELGVNQSKFQQCLDSAKYAQKVKDQMAKGSEEGVSGTPGTIIIDAKGQTQLVPGALPFEQIKSMIDSALKQ